MAEQFRRATTLLVGGAAGGIDLSDLRIKFKIRADDEESPNNADIRVYNVSEETINLVTKVFTEVVLEAGYESNLGVIFKGTIKQYRVGRESGTDTYLDILAADGDVPYQDTLINRNVPAGTNALDRAKIVIDAMKDNGLTGDRSAFPERFTGGILPRGKVLWGTGKVHLRQIMQSVKGDWSIQQGVIQLIPKDGYLPSEAVVLNGQTGLIGRAEQTVDGVLAKCLINPMIKVGQLIRLENQAINQTLGGQGNTAQVPFDRYAGLQRFARIAEDGLYRVYVIEYDGDTRGQEWYSDLVLLALDPATNLVISE